MQNVDPLEIRFTHSKIRNRFSGNSMKITDTLDQILSHKITANDIPMIQVIVNNGIMYSLNNRRLYLFKELRKRGVITEVPVRMKQAFGKLKSKLTPENCSLEAKMTMN